MDKKLGFEGQKRLNDHRQRRTRRPHVEANGCAVGGDILGVSGPQTPIFCPFGSRNGSETAEKRLQKRPSFGQGHGQRFY